MSAETIQYDGVSQPLAVETSYNTTTNILTKNFYANGAPIVLSDYMDGGSEVVGVTITVTGQSSPITISKNDTKYQGKDVSAVVINVFGGSKDAGVSSSNITVNGGLLTKVYGGGYGTSASSTAHVKTVTINVTGGTFEETLTEKSDSGIVGGGLGYSTVETVNLTMSGGSTQFLIGGGIHSITGSSAGSKDDPYMSVSTKTTITISENAKIDYLFGGAQGYGKVIESEINFNGGTTKELIGSGSNGTTLKTTIYISGGNVTDYAFTVNRGAVAESATINVTGGTVAALYAGAAQESKETTGTITGTTSLNVTGGTITRTYLGLGLDDANVTINIGNNTIYAQGGADGTANLFKNYTIATDKTWTLTSGTLEVKEGSSIINNGTIVVNDYQSLVNAAKIGGNIQLGKNIISGNSKDPVIFTNEATLDLSGTTLTLNGAAIIRVNAGGDLTITDSSNPSAGKIDYTVASDEDSAIKVVGAEGSDNVANLTLEKCEIVVNNSNGFKGYGVLAATYSNVISGKDSGDDGDVKITAGYSAISGNGTYLGTNLTINSGTYESEESAAVYFPCNGDLTVNGGVFEGKSGFDIRAGNISISNATITTHGKYTDVADNLNKSRADLPAVWGIGIAVFDHNSYSSGETITLNIDNVTFACENSCNIFVGKHPANAGGSYDGTFSDARIALNHTINVTIKNVEFGTKGLYINGANDVKITECKFTNISESPILTTNPNLYSNAIYLLNCTGDITIGGNTKADGNTISASNSKPMRGIYLDNCGASDKSLLIQNNTISDVNFNALQLTALKFSTVNIEDNTISNWDADNDGTIPSSQSGLYAGGRAIRMIISSTSTGDVTISNNTFSRSYVSDADFNSDLKESNAGYDDGNILKLTIYEACVLCHVNIDNNTLILKNIVNYYNEHNMFKFEEKPTGGPVQVWDVYKVVIFDPNNGYYNNSSEPGVMCSIVTETSKVSEPADPSRSGSYSFDDWYTLKTGGEKWDFSEARIPENTTLYAHWKSTSSGSGGGVPITPPATDKPVVKEDEVKNDDGTTSSITETTTKKENADGSKETTVKKDEVVKDESGKTQAVITETSKTTENKDGSKETVVQKKEEVKDESGKIQSVIEEKHNEVVSKDGSVNKTSETTVKDSAGKVVEAKTEVKIEDKNTGVSTSAEITKDSSGKTTSEIKTEASIETKNGKAEVDSKAIDEALKQAEAAKKTVEEKGVKDVTPVIEINAEKSKDFTETQIAADDLSKLAEAEVEVKIKTATGEVNLPPEVSKNLSSNKDEKVSLAFGEADKQKLTEEQKKTVGDAPVFEFNLKSGDKDIHDLGGTAKVTVPYELKKGEDPNKITVWYLDEEGKPVAMNSVYDSETKSITFETTHFSYYFIAEDAAIQDDKKDDSSSNNTTYYAVAAVIIILIIIALAYYFMKKKQ